MNATTRSRGVLRSRRSLTMGLVALALVPGALAARPVTPRGDLTPEERINIDIFERSKRSVVYIATSERVRELFSRNL